MTILRMAMEGVRHHWRAHLGACIGATLCAMVLTGSLLVGDSLKGTLHAQAQARVGRVVSALVGGEHFFRGALAAEISSDAAPVLFLTGSASKADGSARLNQIQVLGVDARFWALSPEGDRRELQPGDAVVSSALAARLGLSTGDSFSIRVEKPSAFSKDAPLSGEEDAIEALRARVVAVADDPRFGRFALQAGQVPPATVFLPLEQLQQRLEVASRVNLLLSSQAPESLHAAARSHWSAEDSSLEVRTLAADAGFEIRSSRVFLEDGLVRALPLGEASLTYFVNELRAGEAATPYSMVTAARPGSQPFLPADLAPDELVISDWLAQDLGVEAGGALDLKYLVMNAKRQFEERSCSFRIRAVAELDKDGWDGSWMPDFPGLADAGNCREWKPGFALDTSKIRDKDEAYWKKHRGAPKAFMALDTGRELWGNRWGATTGVRYPGDGVGADAVAAVSKALNPSVAGVQEVALKALADAATNAPVDFAGLFLGFSLFLIWAALALVGLLFGLMVENRVREAGTLLAMGWPVFWVRVLFLCEGLGVAVLGGVLGTLLGVGYTHGLLAALASIWSGATGGAEISFYAVPASLAIGLGGSSLAALCAMAWTTRRGWKRSVRELLAGEGGADTGKTAAFKRARFLGAAFLFGLPGGGLLLHGVLNRRVDAEAFFSAGSLLLISALLLSRIWLGSLAEGSIKSIRQLALRNLGRRPGRAVAVIAVLAAGGFLVLSVQVFRKEAQSGPGERTSGTGGFALLGELAAPVYEDLNLSNVRDSLGLPIDEKQPQVNVLAVRVREGEEASCLNLNRAVRPRVLGVPSADFERLGAFRFVEKGAGWAVLRQRVDAGTIPAVVDEDTLMWALQKQVGDEISLPDGRGSEVRVRIVATLGGSVLQGALIVDEARFTEAFPNAGGYRMLFLDAPPAEIESVRATWSRALQDRGLELRATADRLSELQAVSNTYLAIFQVLGGLGVLLGAVGVGVVAARNVVERRVELAVLEAGGWSRRQIRRLLLVELLPLVVLGLVIGGGCAWLVTVPGQWIRGSTIQVGPFANALAVLGGVSLIAVWAALRATLGGDPGDVLRKE